MMMMTVASKDETPLSCCLLVVSDLEPEAWAEAWLVVVVAVAV